MSQLNKLLKMVITGNGFYRQAQDRIRDRDLQPFFEANIRDREHIAEQLKQAGGEISEAWDEAELEARLREHKAELLAVLKSNDASVYINQLADLESETHRAFEAALAAAPGATLRGILEGLKSDFDRIHERSQSAQNAAGNREAPTTLPTRMMRYDTRKR